MSTIVLLRLEAALIAVLALVSYDMWGLSWWLFALPVLAPDLSMLGYLRGPRIGAVCYNAFHVYFVALAISFLGWWSGSQLVLSIGIIWVFPYRHRPYAWLRHYLKYILDLISRICISSGSVRHRP